LNGARNGDQSTARALYPDELVELSRGDLIEIGAHTVSHPILNTLQEQELKYEILESKRVIEAILGKPPVCFSCPHGSWSENIRNCLIDVGFNCALTSENNAVSLQSDPYQLPRLWIGDWEKDTFAKQLRHWKGLLR
jgi:peptidoglycan/xylan/chitin deacetylase (PgdA/CDA1 family)